MPTTKILQTNFIAGELAPELGMRLDTEQYQNGAKSLRNRRCQIGGGSKRRPGSWRLQDLTGPDRLIDFVVNESTKYVLAFGPGYMKAYLDDGTPAGSITSCPWTGDIWLEMGTSHLGDTLFLVHEDMITQVITRTTASTWSFADFAFFLGIESRPEQPYLKLAPAGMTLQPSALTGSITLTVSAAWFNATYIGTYVRYVQKACLITAVAADGLSATATVIETLRGTQRLTVPDTSKFSVGEVVEGSSTGTKGVVTLIFDATRVEVILTYKRSFSTADSLVGPSGSGNISAVTNITAAAFDDWDEQVFSPVWGYPSCVELHRNRLLFSGHPAAPGYMFGSQIGNLYNFNVGTGLDAEGISEAIGDGGASKIVQMHSAEQLIVLTDRGPYYVPESATAPFRPSSIAFYPFGSNWNISQRVKVQPFDGGVIIVSGSIVIKLTPTGDQSRAWTATEVSLLSAHLVKSPTEAAVTTNFAGGQERYCVLKNDDGTLAVMQLVVEQTIRNFTPWDTDGVYNSVAALSDQLFASTTRVIGGNTRYFLEVFDQDLTVDCASEVNDLDVSVQAIYGATAVHVLAGFYHLGTVPITIPNPPAGPYIVGLDYTAEIELFPPVINSQEGSQAAEYMRIVEAFVHVKSSARFSAEGYELQAYQIGNDFSQPPPELNGAQRFQFLGWEREPTLLISQIDPLPLDILAVKTTVAF